MSTVAVSRDRASTIPSLRGNPWQGGFVWGREKGQGDTMVRPREQMCSAPSRARMVSTEGRERNGERGVAC